MDELRPCPFCGGKMKVVNFMPHRPDGYWQGMCYKCGIKTKCIQTPEEAITALNRRPAPENKPRLLDTIHDLRNENARLRTEIERMRNTAPENKPLTLEQLRRMDGQPVWWWNKSHAPVCTICIARFNEVSFVDFDYSHDDSTGIVKYERWVKWGFKPYARKPEQEAASC